MAPIQILGIGRLAFLLNAVVVKQNAMKLKLYLGKFLSFCGPHNKSKIDNGKLASDWSVPRSSIYSSYRIPTAFPGDILRIL